MRIYYWGKIASFHSEIHESDTEKKKCDNRIQTVNIIFQQLKEVFHYPDSSYCIFPVS